MFGVSSDECLNYATQNRREWEQRGQDIVDGYIRAFRVAKGEAAVVDSDDDNQKKEVAMRNTPTPAQTYITDVEV